MSNKLKAAVDAVAGEHNWYIAGGAAAYWHIANYEENGPRHLHQPGYFDSVMQQIFPGDVEGYTRDHEVSLNLDGKFGLLRVELHAANGQFDTSQCDLIDGIYVLNTTRLIDLYQKSSDLTKVAKRNMRIAMLRIINAGIGLSAANVLTHTPGQGPNLGNQIKLGFTLKKTDSKFL